MRHTPPIDRASSVRGDAPQGYLLRCVGIAPYEITGGVCVYISGRTESSAPTHVHRKIMRPPSGGSFHLIACSSPSNTGALKNSPSVMSSPSQSILMVSSLGF